MTPTRREALQWFVGGASALLASCDGRRHGEVHPGVEVSPGVPGAVTRYATSRVEDGFGFGLLARVVDGRPITMEGNDAHPGSLGGTSPRDQACVLSLYDPDRARYPLSGGVAVELGVARGALLEAMGPRGRGTALLLEPTTSPRTLALVERARERWPELAVYTEHDATPAPVWGEPVLEVPDLLACDRLVLLDADPLGSGPARLALCRGWAEGRRRGVRTWSIETAPTLSGARADDRHPVRPSRLPHLVAALAQQLLGAPICRALPAPVVSEDEARFIDALARDVRGRRVAFVAGGAAPAWVSGVAALMSTPGVLSVRSDPRLRAPGLPALADALDAGGIEAVIILGGDVLATAPLSLRLPERLARARRVVYAGRWYGATVAHADLCLPLCHDFERWGDARAWDGTVGLLQPTIRPLHGTPSQDEVLAWLAGAPPPGAPPLPVEVISLGVVPGTALAPLDIELDPRAIAALCARSTPPPPEPIEVVVRPAPFSPGEANNPWLQEMPDPITRVSWGNTALLSPATAADLGVSDGDELALTSTSGRRVHLPARVLPLVADGTLATTLGYGLDAPSVAAGVGADARGLDGPVTVQPTGRRIELALAQVQDGRAGYDVARDGSVMEVTPEALARTRAPAATAYAHPIRP